MDKFRIRGGKPLRGTVRISGARTPPCRDGGGAANSRAGDAAQHPQGARHHHDEYKLLAFMSANVSVHEIPAETYTIETKSMNDAVAPYEPGEDHAGFDPDVGARDCSLRAWRMFHCQEAARLERGPWICIVQHSKKWARESPPNTVTSRPACRTAAG